MAAGRFEAHGGLNDARQRTGRGKSGPVAWEQHKDFAVALPAFEREGRGGPVLEDFPARNAAGIKL